MSIKVKLAIPTLFGLALIILFIEFAWQPYQLQHEKALFQLHSVDLIKAAETGISQPLLKKDFGTLFSNLEQLEEINKGRWNRFTLFTADNRQIYPIASNADIPTPAESVPIEYTLKVSDIVVGKITLDMDWFAQRRLIISQIDSIKNMMIGIMLLIILITTLGQYQVIYRPIKKLVRATKNVQAGNLHPELPKASADEFGELTNSFSDMLVELALQKSALDNHAIVSSTDHDGIITQVNNRYTAVSGYSARELIGETHAVVNSGKHTEEFFELLWQTILRGKTWSGEICNRKKDGTLYRVNTSIVPCLDAAGIPNRFIWIQTDISIQKAEVARRRVVETSLSKERQRLDYILQGTNLGTWEWDVQSGETRFNQQWAKMLGYSLEEIAPTTIETFARFAHPDDLAVSSEQLDQHFKGDKDYYECEVRLQHRDGHWIWVLDRGKVFSWAADGKPTVMYGTHQDITDRKIAEEKILHLATHDQLTNLPNLQVIRDRVDVALKQARRNNSIVALLFVDLDGFKAVNDTTGHHIGNLLLTEAAERISNCVRESDTVARIGGDEFLILLQNLKVETEAADVAQKVVHSVNQPVLIEGHSLQVGASVGISVYPIHGHDFETLLKVADEAMYLSKKAGKNGYTFA
jgi:diguanylate cyclase (GGDEF)-like protein/PAS domain S-box-containing protein